jgi:hypothetical protein
MSLSHVPDIAIGTSSINVFMRNTNARQMNIVPTWLHIGTGRLQGKDKKIRCKQLILLLAP